MHIYIYIYLYISLSIYIYIYFFFFGYLFSPAVLAMLCRVGAATPSGELPALLARTELYTIYIYIYIYIYIHICMYYYYYHYYHYYYFSCLNISSLLFLFNKKCMYVFLLKSSLIELGGAARAPSPDRTLSLSLLYMYTIIIIIIIMIKHVVCVISFQQDMYLCFSVQIFADRTREELPALLRRTELGGISLSLSLSISLSLYIYIYH